MKAKQRHFMLALGIVSLLMLPAFVQSGDDFRTTDYDPVKANSFLLAGSGSMLVTGSQTPTGPKDTPIVAPELFVEAPMFYFGRVLDGTEVAHEFLIENRGSGDLAIEKVLTG